MNQRLYSRHDANEIIDESGRVNANECVGATESVDAIESQGRKEARTLHQFDVNERVDTHTSIDLDE